jgi:Tfp pilus assembly protein PilO
MTPKRFFFVLLGIGVLLVAIAGTGYYFALNFVQSTRDRLATQLAQQAAADDQLGYLGKLKTQYTRDIVPILPLIDQALPHTKNQTEILSQLQTIAGESGLTISQVTFASPSGLPNATSQTIPSAGVLALPISFQVSGSFAQLQTFLTKVETLSRFTNVTTLSVTRPDKSKPIIYAMTVNAYVKP